MEILDAIHQEIEKDAERRRREERMRQDILAIQTSGNIRTTWRS